MKKKILIGSLLVFLLGLVAAVVYLYVGEKPKDTQVSVQESSSSVFGNIAGVVGDTGELSKDVQDKYKDDPVGGKYFMLGWGLSNADPFVGWAYKETPFMAKFISAEFDDATNTAQVELQFTLPLNMPFKGETKIVSVTCNPEYSYISTDQDTKSNVVDILKSAVNGDGFVGFCVDEDCTEVKDFCKIFK